MNKSYFVVFSFLLSKVIKNIYICTYNQEKK